MDDQIEKHARDCIEAIRSAHPDRANGGTNHEMLIGLVERVKDAAPGETIAARRAFVRAVGEQLQAHVGPGRELKVKGLSGTHRTWDDPNGNLIHTTGALLIKIGKQR